MGNILKNFLPFSHSNFLSFYLLSPTISMLSLIVLCSSHNSFFAHCPVRQQRREDEEIFVNMKIDFPLHFTRERATEERRRKCWNISTKQAAAVWQTRINWIGGHLTVLEGIFFYFLKDDENKALKLSTSRVLSKIVEDFP